MNKEEKKNLLSELEADEIYASSLSLISDESERRKVKAYTQEIYLNLVESLTKAIQNITK